jgi:hypothetical protein
LLLGFREQVRHGPEVSLRFGRHRLSGLEREDRGDPPSIFPVVDFTNTNGVRSSKAFSPSRMFSSSRSDSGNDGNVSGVDPSLAGRRQY